MKKPISVRDSDGDGKKSGWEKGRARAMAKAMKRPLKMRKGGTAKKKKK